MKLMYMYIALTHCNTVVENTEKGSSLKLMYNFIALIHCNTVVEKTEKNSFLIAYKVVKKLHSLKKGPFA